MCVYSAFVDSASKQWPGIAPWPNTPTPWNPGPWDGYKPLDHPAVPDPDILREIRELGKRLDALDKKLGAKDCTQEEDAKRAFEKRVDGLIEQAESLKKSVRCDDGNQSAAGNATTGLITGGNTSGYAKAIAGYAAGVSLGCGTASNAKGLY